MSPATRLNMNVESRENPDRPDSGIYRVVDLNSGWCWGEFFDQDRVQAYNKCGEIQKGGYDLAKVAVRLHKILDAAGDSLQLGDYHIQHNRLTDDWKARIEVSRLGGIVDLIEANGCLISQVYLQLEGERVYYHVKGRVYAKDIFGI